MSEKKQMLELTWIGKEKRLRLGQAKSLEILAKVAAVGPMKKSGADDGRARSLSAPPAADGKAVALRPPNCYCAETGMAAINELQPVLGLELTATPRVVKETEWRYMFVKESQIDAAMTFKVAAAKFVETGKREIGKLI